MNINVTEIILKQRSFGIIGLNVFIYQLWQYRDGFEILSCAIRLFSRIQHFVQLCLQGSLSCLGSRRLADIHMMLNVRSTSNVTHITSNIADEYDVTTV